MASDVQVVEYLDGEGHSPFARWLDRLDATASAMVAAVLYRLSVGNFSNVKGVGGGIFERRIDSGPGYRIYFGEDGEAVIVLLGGGTKRRQSESITAARRAWRDYKSRKRGS